MQTVNLTNDESILAYEAARKALELVEDRIQDSEMFPGEFGEGEVDSLKEDQSALNSLLDKLTAA
jgi:hypothetical protein